MPAGNVSVEAVFEHDDVTLTFAAGADATVDGQATKTYDIAYDTAFAQTVPDAVKAGYRFTGWKADGDDTVYTAETVKKAYTADTTYTAQFVQVFDITSFTDASNTYGTVKAFAYNAETGVTSDAELTEAISGTTFVLTSTVDAKYKPVIAVTYDVEGTTTAVPSTTDTEHEDKVYYTMPAADVTIDVTQIELDYIGTSEAAETFDDYTNAKFSAYGTGNVTEVEKPEVGSAATSGDPAVAYHPTYIKGKAFRLASGKNASNSSKFTLDSPVEKGKVYFVSDVATDNEYVFDGGNIQLLDNSGTAVVDFQLPNSKGSYYTVVSNTNAKTGETNKISTSPSKNLVKGFSMSITADLDANSASITFDYIGSEDSIRYQETKPLAIAANSNIGSLNLFVKSTRSANSILYLDNTKFYAETAVPNKAYTVNYKLNDTDSTLIKSETKYGITGGKIFDIETNYFEKDDTRYVYDLDDSEGKTIATDGSTVVNVTVHEAATYTVNVVPSTDENTILNTYSVTEKDSCIYSYPAYVTDASHKVTASYGGSTYTGTITPTKDETVTIEYTAYTGTAYFVEYETLSSSGPLTNNANVSNGGSARALASPTAAFTIGTDDAGTYTISIRGYCRNTKSDTVASVYKNGTATSDPVGTIIGEQVNFKGASINGPTIQTVSGELAANDAIYVIGDEGNTNVDYVLAVKSAE